MDPTAQGLSVMDWFPYVLLAVGSCAVGFAAGRALVLDKSQPAKPAFKTDDPDLMGEGRRLDPEEKREASVTARWIAASMKSSPEDWAVDEHYARHNGGASVWIANGLGHINYAVPGVGPVKFPYEHDLPLHPDQIMIWKAFKEMQRQRESAALTSYIMGCSHAP
jgi:hypothetical protein